MGERDMVDEPGGFNTQGLLPPPPHRPSQDTAVVPSQGLWT